MKIGELEKASGLPRSTIHHYVREGLLSPPSKTGKTMAYYDEKHLKRLREISRIKSRLLKKHGRSRVPIEAIKLELDPDHSLAVASIKAERKTARRLEIIEATIRLYLENGFYQTRLSDVAKAVGISPSTFYLYFPDQRELFAEVIEHVVNQAISEIEDQWQDKTEPLQRMVVLARVFTRYHASFSGILSQLRAGAAQNDEWSREKLKKIYRDMIGFLSREIERGMEAGIVRPTDAELLSFLIIGGADAMAQTVALDNKYTPNQVLTFWFDCVLRIIRPDQPGAGGNNEDKTVL
jgi:AcrR family transcriptional regulator